MSMKVLTGFIKEELELILSDFLKKRKEPGFRTRQIVEWIYRKFSGDFKEMSNLPGFLRTELDNNFKIHALKLKEELKAEDGAQKFLFLTEELFPVESVLLPVKDGATYCISVSSGCPLSCTFCASGKFFNRQLNTEEIVDQYLLLRSLTGDNPHFSGIVLMGMGEPALNWNSTREFLMILRDLGGVGARRITVSTVGSPDLIEALGAEFPQVKLAVSLHAATDELRRWIVPYAKNCSLKQLFDSCRKYVDLTSGKRITFEYVLLAGVNDRETDARDLAELLRGLPAVVNLIPFNSFPGSFFSCTDDPGIQSFTEDVRRYFKGEVTVRRSLGATANAACGQLGLRHTK